MRCHERCMLVSISCGMTQPGLVHRPSSISGICLHGFHKTGECTMYSGVFVLTVASADCQRTWVRVTLIKAHITFLKPRAFIYRRIKRISRACFLPKVIQASTLTARIMHLTFSLKSPAINASVRSLAHLCTLPAELRFQIYEYLLEGWDLILAVEHGLKLRTPLKCGNLLSLMLSCKQVCVIPLLRLKSLHCLRY